MSQSTPPSHITEPDFFIIESLSLDDERDGRYDGKFLFNYLKILNKNPLYFYIRSRRELEEISNIFRATGYKYLYLSCHGSDNAISTTFDTINFKDFAEIFTKKLEHRRLFVSGCSLGKKEFADELFNKNGGMFSLTAPKKDILFAQMIPFWASFFYSMLAFDTDSMKSKLLYRSLQQCADMFNIDMVHFNKHPKKGIASYEFTANYIYSDEEIEKFLQLNANND